MLRWPRKGELSSHLLRPQERTQQFEGLLNVANHFLKLLNLREEFLTQLVQVAIEVPSALHRTRIVLGE